MADVDLWMPLYIGDYMSGTSRLTTEQHGAYLLLIMDYWKNGALPDNDAILAQITRLSPDAWSMHRAVLEHFFTVENGEWKHKRIEREMNAARDKKQKASEKAKAAAQARWEKEADQQAKQEQSGEQCSKHATSNTQAMHEECPSPSPSPSPLQTPAPSEKKSPQAAGSGEPGTKKKNTYPEEFERAWKAYPKRNGDNPKRSAHQAWAARVKSGADPEAIIAGVQRYARWVDATGKTNTEFVKRAVAFFGPDEHYLEDWSPPNGAGGPGQSHASKHTGFADQAFTQHLPDWATQEGP